MTEPPPKPAPARDAQDWAIHLEHVAKTYKGKVHALRGISMKVRRGEVFGLLGPNGAGKSTLVKILMTVIFPSACQGSLLGHPVGHKPTLAGVGYLPEHHRFPGYLTGSQVLDFYGAMANVPRAERKRRGAELLDLVGMSQWGGKKVRGYSKGMRQRLGIAQALVHDPDLVLLDEPTDGVDPVGRKEIRAILSRLKDQGKTIFLNSHLLSELEMICDRVAILVQGNVVSEGTIDELTTDQRRFEIRVPDDQASLMDNLTAPGGVESQRTDALLRVATEDAAVIQPLIDELRSRKATITDVRMVRPSLEDLFMQAVEDPQTGGTKGIGAAPAQTKGAQA